MCYMHKDRAIDNSKQIFKHFLQSTGALYDRKVLFRTFYLSTTRIQRYCLDAMKIRQAKV